jgi:hypothetical protein
VLAALERLIKEAKTSDAAQKEVVARCLNVVSKISKQEKGQKDLMASKTVLV